MRKLAPERALPVYTVDEPVCMLADWLVVAVTAPPVGPGDLEALLRRLLPTAPVMMINQTILTMMIRVILIVTLVCRALVGWIIMSCIIC